MSSNDNCPPIPTEVAKLLVVHPITQRPVRDPANPGGVWFVLIALLQNTLKELMHTHTQNKQIHHRFYSFTRKMLLLSILKNIV